MAAELITLPFRPVINLRGGLESGAALDVFATGTTTPVSVFADAALATPLTNPVVADAFGVFPTVYYDDALTVRVRVKQANGTVLSDTDPYDANPASAEASADAAAASASIAAALSGKTYGSTAEYYAGSPVDQQEFTVRATADAPTGLIYFNNAGTPIYARLIIFDPSAPGTAALIGGVALPVATRTALKAIETAKQTTAILTEAGRGGMFTFLTGDYSAQVAADTLEGIYIASDGTASSAGAWVRLWDGINAKPEWFGVVVNSSGAATANLAAINACIVLCPVTQFGNADYWVNGRVNVQTPYRTIQGVRGDGYNTGTGTRILSLDLTVPVVRFGPDAQPASLAAHMRGIVSRDLTFSHIGDYVGPSGGSEASAVPVIDRRWLIKAVFERLNAWEPLIGVYSRGLVQCYTTNCKVLRTAARVSSGTDFCWANFIDGNPPASGLPGNPSIYEATFAAEFNPSLAVDKVGVVCTADFADVFLDSVETSNATSGIRLLGSGTKAQINCHIRNSVIDQCSGTALDIQGLAAGSCVNIEGGYYQANDTAVAVIHARGGNGTVNITGGCQIVGGQAGDMIGLYAQGQKQINVGPGVTILECPRPIVMTGVTGAQLLCSMQNDTVGDATQPIIATDASDGMKIAIQARGKNDAFARGIDLVGTANTRVSIDPTLIDRNIISGGAANMIYADPFGTPVAITAPGYYNSSGATGTTGAGIEVRGLTA